MKKDLDKSDPTNDVSKEAPSIEALKKLLLDDDRIQMESKLKQLEDKVLSLQTQLDKKIEDVSSSQYHKSKISENFIDTLGSKVENNPSDIATLLAPMIGSGLQNQIKADKDKIVDALYPVIGSTISKYMAESMKELVVKINKKIEDTLSFKKYITSIKNKITGKSNPAGMGYISATPESFYLIHKLTGAVIIDGHSEESNSENTQMVGGMFTAITSFVNDWIEKDGENKVIDSIDYGDSTIIFETSGSLILAVVVSVGELAPVKAKARNILATLHSQDSGYISDFNGDLSSLPDSFKKAFDDFL